MVSAAVDFMRCEVWPLLGDLVVSMSALPKAVGLPIALYLVFGLGELFFPAQSGHGWRGRARNLFLTLIAGALGAVVVALVSRWLNGDMRPAPDRTLVQSLVAVALAALLTDVVFYWYHRLQHRFRPLWAIHELHHADGELNVTTSLRAYWLDRPLQTFVIGIPVTLLIGIDQRAALILSFLLPTWLFFAHANWRLGLGPLTPLVCGPQVHRIHHSNLAAHRDKNFAQYFPFIDIVFGTYYAPAASEFPTTGTPELASDAPLATIMARPFRIWTGRASRQITV